MSSKASSVVRPTNTKDLFEFLTGEMKRLREGDVTVEYAKAQCNLAATAINLLNYELKRAVIGDRYTIREIEEGRTVQLQPASPEVEEVEQEEQPAMQEAEVVTEEVVVQQPAAEVEPIVHSEFSEQVVAWPAQATVSRKVFYARFGEEHSRFPGRYIKFIAYTRLQCMTTMNARFGKEWEEIMDESELTDGIKPTNIIDLCE